MGGRLFISLAALLGAVAVAGRLTLPPPPPSATAPEIRTEARRVAREALLARMAEAGVAVPESFATAGGPGLEELAAGFPAEHDARRDTVIAIPFTIMLAVMGLLAAWLMGRRLDEDLALLARRIESTPAEDDLSTAGMAFSETARLGEAAALALRGDAAPRRMGAGDTAQQRSHLLASVSHDLRSPLNSILGFSELLLRGADGPLDEQLKPGLQRIRVAGKRQLRLVNQILEVARWQAGRLVLEPHATEVAELLSDSVDEFHRVHEVPPEVEIETEVAAGLGPVHVDSLRLAQALSELLGEALASLEAAAGRVGPPAGRIRLEALEERVPDGEGELRRLVLTVVVPVKLRSEARLGSAAAYRVVAPGDLGLGMPLAKALVELHAGTLTVDDGPPPRLQARIPLHSAPAE